MSQIYPKPIARLIEAFESFPGIGRKMAQRLAFSVLKMDQDRVSFIAESILNVKKEIIYCDICCNLADRNPCSLCTGKRDHSVILVVEQPKDVMALERTNEFSGLYHVLHGVISPMENIGPDDIRIKQLLKRLDSGVSEIILALNPTVEGEATSLYLSRIIKPLSIKVTKIASGVSVGTDIEYADEATLSRALRGRVIL
ncbi:MAG: recombination protein RecR [Clostridia bacterium]|nr:recombination protein RecR [Clostridia bacterium]